MRALISRPRICLLASLVLAVLAWPGSAGALSLQPVGTFAAPIYVTSPLGDGRLFVVERAGTIRVVKNGATLGTPFLNVSGLTATDGERGLLSMAFDPNYASNGLFYVLFNDNGGAGALEGDIHVDEFHVSSNPNVANLASRRRVLTIPHSATNNHNGGQLQFGKDGLLYISTGDAGFATAANSQTTSNLLGKILRINPHGASPGAHKSPRSNPFAATPGARPEIWSLGLRNPWRFSFDHLNGDMVIGDVGSNTAEEVDFAPTWTGLGRGVNYGWPSCEGYGDVYGGSCAGFTAPVFVYLHSGCLGGYYAITGGFVYRGSDIPPLAGRYVYADLCKHTIRSLRLGLPTAIGDRSEGGNTGADPVSFGEDGRCELYVAAGNVVSKLVTSPGAQPGAGLCPRFGVKVKLRAKQGVRSGRKVKFKATASPCVGAAAAGIQLRRRGKVIKTAKLDGSCAARFRIRIKKTGRFKAVVSEDARQLGGVSNGIKVRIRPN